MNSFNKSISIIIPTFNEAGNIAELVRRIHLALVTTNIKYEIIFIDDHSKDDTQEIIRNLAVSYPIRLVLKKGKRGKAFSLLEGFPLASYPFLAIIDADLQYPPEAIPYMMAKLKKFDIVVAERHIKKTSWIRNILSSGFMKIFGGMLHGIHTDIQSGLKVFRKEITDRIDMNPSQWTFDLEFLVKAREAGYKITEHKIVFQKRRFGKSKVSLLATIVEIGLSSLKLKIRSSDIIPYYSHFGNRISSIFHYKGNRYVTYTKFDKKRSALDRITFQQVLFLLAIVATLIASFIVNWHTTIIVLFGILTFFYFLDIFFYFYVTIMSFSKLPEIKIVRSEMDDVPESTLPTYTILCPLYKEWRVIPQFIKAIANLDYPKNKLQVLLLLEEDDLATILNMRRFDLPPYFHTIIVPHSYPKTKPKACNYGLIYAQGEYSVIFDAEDIPEKDQLKKVVCAFRKLPRSVACIQAKLNFYNPEQNILTNLFTSEYSLWFDLILPGLQALEGPIPLGGTSNHFRTLDLQKLNGWDAFNVTEDCDLGVRLSKSGFSTAIVDSTTFEEANSSPRNWFSQRTRWIKGYIQTFFVHTRKLKEGYGMRESFIFQLVVGGKVLLLFINPLMWIVTITYFAARPFVGDFIESFFPSPVLYMGVTSLIVGNFLYFYSYMIGCAKRHQYHLIKYTFLIPFYWILMSMAAWAAVYKFVKEPHYWSKTIHGLHLPQTPVAPGVVSSRLSV